MKRNTWRSLKLDFFFVCVIQCEQKKNQGKKSIPLFYLPTLVLGQIPQKSSAGSLTRVKHNSKRQINTFKSLKTKLPKGIENSSIAEDAYEAVFHCDVMQEGTLGVWDEGVRDPEQ